MTIDEAIKHAREMADFCKSEISTFPNPEPYEIYCNGELEKCAGEHEQLVEWLEELKQLRNQQNEVCEWEDSYLSGSEYKRNPHNKIAMSGKYLLVNDMIYCPNCGKKIKFINPPVLFTTNKIEFKGEE